MRLLTFLQSVISLLVYSKGDKSISRQNGMIVCCVMFIVLFVIPQTYSQKITPVSLSPEMVSTIRGCGNECRFVYDFSPTAMFSYKKPKTCSISVDLNNDHEDEIIVWGVDGRPFDGGNRYDYFVILHKVPNGYKCIGSFPYDRDSGYIWFRKNKTNGWANMCFKKFMFGPPRGLAWEECHFDGNKYIWNSHAVKEFSYEKYGDNIVSSMINFADSKVLNFQSINHPVELLSVLKWSENDLKNCSAKELDTVRNHTFARYGLKFRRNDLQELFKNCQWYRPNTDNPDVALSRMTKIDKENVELIVNYQKKNGLINQKKMLSL
jgi:YARHG domain